MIKELESIVYFTSKFEESRYEKIHNVIFDNGVGKLVANEIATGQSNRLLEPFRLGSYRSL